MPKRKKLSSKIIITYLKLLRRRAKILILFKVKEACFEHMREKSDRQMSSRAKAQQLPIIAPHM